eukprot:CAMPEP_0170463524 /NCGR_PEP_ID=MMETSP0123-20130129/8608_1 /TAXON_ID=182087 /ORGANISM="Favella ehrenbergii, Strain Fehren 1" /LENGTH=37 /DNA_ID= /DNA_START= /DNA_END= /DNA_ORIENTATION=
MSQKRPEEVKKASPRKEQQRCTHCGRTFAITELPMHM